MQAVFELRVFILVAEMLSFTRAADALDVSVAVVTRAIKKLEKELGVRLFHRTTRKVTLTEAGEKFFSDTRDIVQDLDNAVISLKDSALKELRGNIRVCAPSAFSSAFLLDTINEFLVSHPGVQIDLLTSDTAINLVESRIDVAFYIGMPSSENMIVRQLGKISSGLYVASHYIFSKNEVSSPSTIQNCEFVGHSGPTPGWELFGPNGVRVVLTPHRFRLRCNNTILVKKATVLGLGIAMLPNHEAEPLVRAGRLIRILPEWRGRDVNLTAVSSSRTLTLAAGEFINFVKKRFAEDNMDF